VLPAERRVRRREEFTTVVRDGRRVAGDGLVVHLVTEPGEHAPRAGFIVGRAAGPAVLRNRLRRRLRHLVADRLDRFPAGTLLVVRVTARAAELRAAEFARTAVALLDRAADVAHSGRANGGVMSPC
jgi:ribonuclease P protein component